MSFIFLETVTVKW